MFVASLRTTAAVAAVFFLLTVTFLVLGIGNAGGHEASSSSAAGSAWRPRVAAWYASFAMVVNSTFGRDGDAAPPARR